MDPTLVLIGFCTVMLATLLLFCTALILAKIQQLRQEIKQ